jgi:hypothetical protein
MSRDVVLARLAAARGLATRIAGQVDEAIEYFLLPEEDPKGEERIELFESVIDDAGRLSRVMEKAEEVFEDCDPLEPSPEEADDDEDEEAEAGDSRERAEPSPARKSRTSRR